MIPKPTNPILLFINFLLRSLAYLPLYDEEIKIQRFPSSPPKEKIESTFILYNLRVPRTGRHSVELLRDCREIAFVG
jgi:hypothetical protein